MIMQSPLLPVQGVVGPNIDRDIIQIGHYNEIITNELPRAGGWEVAVTLNLLLATNSEQQN